MLRNHKWFQSGLHAFERLDAQIVMTMAQYGVPLLRIALALTFIWFGALKVIGLSPVAGLVVETMPWLPPSFVVPAVGIWEIIVGAGLLTRFVLRLTLLFFFMQMGGTFLVLLTLPELAFQNNNPLLLTTIGEFVVKNLVLVSAGLIIGATVRRHSETLPA
ncbi:MAG: DoxX family membrane protein [Chloroflexi bacterium]|nr:DoxX family membrane protein [Chloroflexota bacterium]